MSKAKKHQQTELGRLRSDPEAVALLESESRIMELPSSPIVPTSLGSAAAGLDSAELSLERWRQLVAFPAVPTAQMSGFNMPDRSDSSIAASGPGSNGADLNSLAFDPAYTDTAAQLNPNLFGASLTNIRPSTAPSPTGSQGNLAWLWSDNVFANAIDDSMEINIDFDAEVDWYNWVESAKGAEMNGPGT
jgi:Predicted membrane protein